MKRDVFIVTEIGTYYIERHFAWFPIYCQGTLAWFQSVWSTYLDRGNWHEFETWYPYDPRKMRQGKK